MRSFADSPQSVTREASLRAMGVALPDGSAGDGNGAGGRGGRASGQDHYASTHLDPAVEILDVGIEHADTARRDELADRRRLIGAVDAVDRLAEIECARAERVSVTARHEP